MALDCPGGGHPDLGQCDLRWIGDELRKDDESHREYFQSPAVKVIKQATHRKKDADDIRVFLEENVIIMHK
jgi:hypothetical protein